MFLNQYESALKYGAKILGSEVLGSFNNDFAKVYYVDGDNGSDSNNGLTPTSATATIQAAVTAAAANNVSTKSGSIVFVKARYMAAGSTDPVSYAETITIPAAGGDRMMIVGVGDDRTQGGLPQISKGSGSTALITIQAPGCTIANLGINGVGSTGGGILLDDDGSTKSAFGTAILNCHFKNCRGSSGTNAATGGAVQWSSAGNAWQVIIAGNRFYKNVGDVVLLGTSGSVPQDVIIEDNVFSGPAASVDCNLFLSAGSGMNGVIIRNNEFTCFPAVSAGTNASPLVLTNCVGQLTGNRFATSGKTFGAAANVLVPTTVFMTDNYQEGGTTQITRT